MGICSGGKETKLICAIRYSIKASDNKKRGGGKEYWAVRGLEGRRGGEGQYGIAVRGSKKLHPVKRAFYGGESA